jgi:hypothetical protein
MFWRRCRSDAARTYTFSTLRNRPWMLFASPAHSLPLILIDPLFAPDFQCGRVAGVDADADRVHGDAVLLLQFDPQLFDVLGNRHGTPGGVKAKGKGQKEKE